MEKVVFIFIIAVCCVWITGALKCLQCLDAKEDGPCQHDYMTQVNTSLGIFPNNSKPYYKECPDGTYGVTQDYCVIEKIMEKGKVISFIRDCSDGSNFSFTGDVKNNKLNNLVPDNYTTCVYLMGSRAHVCVSLCMGDFCNSPLPPPNDTELCGNDTDENATCGARALLFGTSGPFGPMVDRLLGRAYVFPVLVAILVVQMFG